MLDRMNENGQEPLEDLGGEITVGAWLPGPGVGEPAAQEHLNEPVTAAPVPATTTAGVWTRFRRALRGGR